MSNEAFEKWWDSDTFMGSPYVPIGREYSIEECSPLYWAHQGWQAAQADQAEYIAMLELNNKFKDDANQKLREALKYIDKDLCYRWITESNSIKAHELISMIMMESSKALGETK